MLREAGPARTRGLVPARSRAQPSPGPAGAGGRSAAAPAAAYLLLPPLPQQANGREKRARGWQRAGAGGG